MKRLNFRRFCSLRRKMPVRPSPKPSACLSAACSSKGTARPIRARSTPSLKEIWEFSFGFCTGDPAAYRRFTFTFASAEDPGESFSVIYESTVGDWTGEENGRGRSGVYVKCGDEFRTTRYWASDEAEAWQNNDNFKVDDALASPMFGGAGEKESEFGVQQGTLRLSWTADNVLEVYVSERF